MIIIIVIVIIGLLISFLIGAYNNIVSKKNLVEEAFSSMDVFLKKRFDMIPNLVATVKGYAKHESETLEKVVNARKMVQAATTIDEKVIANANLSTQLGRLLMLTENYPELKANTLFIDLSGQIQVIEAEIAKSRLYYNGVVRQFNTEISLFPMVIVANLFGFKKATYFEVQNESERENVKVEF